MLYYSLISIIIFVMNPNTNLTLSTEFYVWLCFTGSGMLQECPSGLVNEDTFKEIYAQFFPQGGTKSFRLCSRISSLLLADYQNLQILYFFSPVYYAVIIMYVLLDCQMPVLTHTSCSTLSTKIVTEASVLR